VRYPPITPAETVVAYGLIFALAPVAMLAVFLVLLGLKRLGRRGR
jgi:hypothetical protein